MLAWHFECIIGYIFHVSDNDSVGLSDGIGQIAAVFFCRCVCAVRRWDRYHSSSCWMSETQWAVKSVRVIAGPQRGADSHAGVGFRIVPLLCPAAVNGHTGYNVWRQQPLI